VDYTHPPVAVNKLMPAPDYPLSFSVVRDPPHPRDSNVSPVSTPCRRHSCPSGSLCLYSRRSPSRLRLDTGSIRRRPHGPHKPSRPDSSLPVVFRTSSRRTCPGGVGSLRESQHRSCARQFMPLARVTAHQRPFTGGVLKPPPGRASGKSVPLKVSPIFSCPVRCAPAPRLWATPGKAAWGGPQHKQGEIT